jgi:hypothetical protein
MNIIKKIDQFNKDYVYFCDPIKNNIMTDGVFIRILYSNNLFIMNGIYIFISFQNVSIEKYYNKYRCNFDPNSHNDIIDKIKLIEEEILKKIIKTTSNKIPSFKIYEQMQNGNIKVFANSLDSIHNNFILKISGIWETSENYGVTYKFSAV